MADVVIVGAVRSPIGRRNGALSGCHPVDLAAQVLQSLIARVGIDPSVIEDVVFGCVSQAGEQAANVARFAVLAAGWPESVPATTIDRQCGSSQQAVHFAAASIAAGHCDVVVAGGVESMSRVPMLCTVANGPGDPMSISMRARYGDSLVNQGISAEMIAEQGGFDRRRVDEIAFRSHRRAATAAAAGCFDAEIVPIVDPETGALLLAHDEGIRADADLAVMARLPPAFRPDGVVTAANSSQISDGAAALLLMSEDRARELGVAPLARVRTCVVVGVDPITMLTGPVPATRRALTRAGLGVGDIGVFEVNEAFASVIALYEDAIGADPAKLNPRGGAIALGHPLGATGARVMTTLVHEMRAEGHTFGLQAICEGGGMANATVLEQC